MTQKVLADHLEVSQGNVSFYERGMTVPPRIAKKLIDVAAEHGLTLTFDHVYGQAEVPGQVTGTTTEPGKPARTCRYWES